MKRFSIVMVFLTLIISLRGQQVPRDQVVIEVGTGTWCQYCPGAVMGIEDLLANGYNVAAVKYHSGDSYQTSASIARINYYNITGFPTAWFDGVYNVVGGSNTQSMYPNYIPYVNQRNSVLSSFTLSINGSCTGLQYNVTVNVNKVASYNQNALRLHLALTESHIPEFWQGQTEVNHAMRLMVPDANGTLLDFSTQNQHTVNLSFTVDPAWEIQNCELVAFLQNPVTKEIVQGTKTPLMSLLPTLNNDLGIRSLSNIPPAICQEWVKPVLVVANYGLETATSALLKLKINNDYEYFYNWSGNLPYLAKDTFELDTLVFSSLNSNIISATITNVNGQPDLNATNDSLSVISGTAAQLFKSPVSLVLKTDNNPQETTWELVNSGGQILYNGGPYTEPNKLFIVNMNLPDDCYRFIIHDEGKNGICCSNGNGLYKLVDKNNLTIVSGKNFLMSESTDFRVSSITVISENEGNNLTYSLVDNLLTVQSLAFEPVEIAILDLSVRKIMNAIVPGGFGQISLRNLSSGVYILKMMQGNSLKYSKIFIQ